LTVRNTAAMPFGGELMFLPDRRPVLFNLAERRMETLFENPFEPGEPSFPVAAFNSPGGVISGASAYEEAEGAGFLPLFSYGAVGWRGEGFRTSVIRVDKEPRQDLRRMKPEDVAAGVERMRKRLPGNRLREHLEKCALTYGCPAGKNFFLARYEAPLPTSKRCNARCRGCLSMQKGGEIPHSQDRIGFTPTPGEIAGVALAHIRKVERSVVSFGQGCEGDPLLAADAIEPAIREIRSATDSGTINMNTNGSLPDILAPLLDAGLDSIRVSINSTRAPCWSAYFRPRGYGFEDVERSIDLALGHEKFVALNYLNLPGFTDAPEEIEALVAFIKKHPIHMIQWRNLNFDPIRYLKIMKEAAPLGPAMGTRNLLNRIRSEFPDLKYGYFNPPREKFGRR
ncbi:MAG: radical SAM protein, partial [Desulfobacterales bacterium]|nr:radical SAM protein [Desulfobacterales bacterium]